jgi:glyceraldehyde 3-phosphate dehydrogenase
MTIRVAINGFGRIGRNFLRAATAREASFEIVAINDLVSTDVNAYLLRYDTTHGRFSGTVSTDEHGLVVNGVPIAVYAEREPKALPWSELAVDVVVESTGRFTSRAAASGHLDAGARRVVISAPADDADATFVMGVNDDAFDPTNDVVVSNASCTTNCFVPLVKVLDDAFGIHRGLMTTVHAYTNDQEILDLARDNRRRGRAGASNIVPVSTGAARATHLVLSAMKGRLNGTSLRVPVTDGSITDFTAILRGEVDVAAVNAAFCSAAEAGPLSKVLEYNEDEVVSSDIVGSPASCTFDATLTMTMDLGDGNTLVKVFGWYDNEWGYANRLVDLVGHIGGQ